MKKYLVICLLFIGCSKGESIESHQKGDFKVEFLFEQDGCKMYRFQDGGRDIYWSNCNGKVNSDYETRSKSSTRHHYVEAITTKNP